MTAAPCHPAARPGRGPGGESGCGQQQEGGSRSSSSSCGRSLACWGGVLD